MMMKLSRKASLLLFISLLSEHASAFQHVSKNVNGVTSKSSTTLFAVDDTKNAGMDRRNFGTALVAGGMGSMLNLGVVEPASAKVYLDPAQYGDQELRSAAVASMKETTRRAILKKPALVNSFYTLALLDSLSYNKVTDEFGPDGSILRSILKVDAKGDAYVQNLQEACLTIIDAAKMLKQKTAVTIADAIVIAGAESVESVGGPVLTVQLGRGDAPMNAKPSPIPIDLLSGKRSDAEVQAVFRKAGMTDREMTVLLSALMTLEKVEKSRTTDDWKSSSKKVFRERGKMGRASEFTKLTDEDIARAEEEEEESEFLTGDEKVYIAESFGSKSERFGQKVGKDAIDEKSFNKYIKELDASSKKKKGANNMNEYGWVGSFLTSSNPESATTVQWVNKYSVSSLAYNKDLSIAYNAMTQLGASYTGGKYEALLKDRKRKSLNDDALNIF